MRVLKITLLLGVCAAVLVGVLVSMMPADVGYRYATNYLGPVELSGLRGTIWDGHADGISVFGRDLGELDWHARKLPALTGRFVSDLRIQGADVDMAGVMTRTAGSLSVHELRFSLPASLVAPALNVAGLQFSGTITGVVDQATLVAALLHDVTGSARWTHAAISGVANLHLADMIAEFASLPDGSLDGRVRDDGSGSLAVDAHFNARLGAFDAEATLRARSDDPAVGEALRRIGEPQADGSSRLEIHDRMPGMP